MPLYTDSNYYYAGGSSQMFAPYYPSGVYSLPSVSSAYAPYTSNYSRTVGGSYMLPIPTARSTPSTYTSHGLNSRYQPKLSTIGESSALIISSRHGGLLPLTRTHSPKISSYSSTSSHALHSKYIPPRPININTADIDVSSARYRRQREEERRQEKDKIKVEAEENQCPARSKESTAKIEVQTQQKNEIPENKSRRSTIKRNRPIVRLSTMRTRSKPIVEPFEPEAIAVKDTEQNNEEVIGWRQRLANDLTLLSPSQTKKSPGQLLRERFLIHDPNTETQIDIDNNKIPKEEDQMLVQVDPDTHICHVSIPSGPSFHDICEDISSDKIDDDLNAGALRKRASIIQEREEKLMNQLQHSASGSFQMIHLERRSSHDSISDETPQTNKRRSKKTTKNKHTITALVDVQNAPLTPILQENDEDQFSPHGKISPPKPKMSYNVEAVEEHHKINKILKLPKKKSIKESIEIPEGFVQASPKCKRASKSSRFSKKKKINMAEIFTFDTATIKQQQEKEQKFSKSKSLINNPMIETILKQKVSKDAEKTSVVPQKESKDTEKPPDVSTAKIPLLQKVAESTNNLKPSTSADIINVPKVIPLKTSRSLDSTSINTSIIKSKVNTESKIELPTTTSIQKSESIDFWDSIGNRDSIYMENRKKILEQTLKQPIEKNTEPSQLTLELQQEKLSSDIKHLANKTNILERSSLLNVEPSKIIQPKNINTKEIINENEIQETSQSTKNDKSKTSLGSKSNPELKKTNSFKNEKTDSSLKISVDTERAKSAEPDNKTIVNFQIDKKEPTNISPTKKTSSDISTKIQFGQMAKSPEQQPEQPNNTNNNIMKIAPTTVITISTMTTSITTTTTTTTATIKTAVTETINEKANKSSEVQTTINNNVNLERDVKKIGTLASTTKSQTKTTTNSTMAAVAATRTKTPAATTTTAANKINEIQAVTEVKKKPDAPHKKSTPATNIFEIETIDSNTKLYEKPTTATTKTITTTTKASTLIKKEDSSEKKNVAIINKAKTSPINADGFITVAPAKSALSPTTSKNKNASPIINKTISEASTTTTAPPMVNNKLTDKVKITASNNTGAIKLNALAITPTPTIATKTTTATKTSDMVAIVTSAIKTNTTTASSCDEQQKQNSERTDVENNFSKIATVLDLAQCLRDVDADLEDYIPSSAENSDNDLTDDSTFYCSSVDGCENLSASMKKKLKQKKRKEKQQAEKQAARFDPHKKVKIDTTNKCYVKDEAPRYPLVATPRPLWKREKIVYPEESSEESDSDESGGSTTTEDSEESEECTTSEEEYEHSGTTSPALATGATTSNGSSVTSKDNNSAIIRMSTCSNDSGFEGGTAPSSPKKMLGKCARTLSLLHIININKN